MSKYTEEIARIPLLTDEETTKLIYEMQNGNENARQLLIKHNLRIVLKIAYKFQTTINLSIDDLVQIGVFGLIKAIDNFDINRNVKLSTVTYPYIENAFKKYIYISKMPKRDNSKDISLQSPVYENKNGSEITLEETLEDDGAPIEEIVFQNSRTQTIKKILQKLTKEEREILYLRFGIVDGINHTLEEIGNQKNKSRELIRQKEAKALKKLKHPKITKQIKDFFEE